MLARVVQTACESLPKVSLSGLLCPTNFKLLVAVAKKLSTEKDKPSPHVGRWIGNLLRKACKMKISSALKSGDKFAQQEAMDFDNLLDFEWNLRVVRRASHRAAKEKMSRLPAIPITTDVVEFSKYLLNQIEDCCHRLKKRSDPDDWVRLSKCLMCYLLLLNGRRRSKVKELNVRSYMQRPQWQEQQSPEVCLTPVDKIRLKR